MPNCLTPTAADGAMTSGDPVPALSIQAARIGQQAYALLAAGTVEKSTPAVAAALNVSEQQLLGGMSAYVYVQTGWDLTLPVSRPRRSPASLPAVA